MLYVCSKCDAQHPKWAGRCGECGAWGTLHEGEAQTKKLVKSQKKKISAAPAAVSSVITAANKKVERLEAKSFPASKVFPKGITLGSMTLLSGEPGAGKSTLSMQLAIAFASHEKVLYISAEESTSQITERGNRLGPLSENILIAESNALEEIIATIEHTKAKVVVVDSLQTITSQESDAELGSVNQVRIVTAALSEYSRDAGIALIAIGHVTKDGALAGPKSLEHLVDAVYYLEADRKSAYRLLRSYKNRYGDSTGVLVLKLVQKGLIEVKDAATIFIKNYREKPGAVLTVSIVDHQPFFLEVQALVSRSSFGYAKRTSSGFPKQRLELLLAIMKKALQLDFDDHDVYVNIAGGFKVSEPAMDLAVVLAVLSSIKESSLPPHTIVFGEVGLSGELRLVTDTGERLKAITENGFKTVYIPSLEKSIKSKLTVYEFESLAAIVKKLEW